MLTKAERETLAAEILTLSTAPETEVLITCEDLALARFVHDDIHQNISADVVTIRVRVIIDGRTGCAETNSLRPSDLEEMLKHAAKLAEFAPCDGGWSGLVQPHTAQLAPSAGYDAATAQTTPAERADLVAELLAGARAHNAWAAGYISSATMAVTVANSHGVLQSYDATDAIANVKYTGATSTGYAEHCATAFSELHGTEIARTAGTKVQKSANPITIEPGFKTVILEPAAFGELLSYLAEHFSAQAIEEGASFLTFASAGQQYTDTSFTLYDDCRAPQAPGMPFDYEGAPKRKLRLLENGVAHDIATDSRFAARLHRPNTGHALPAPNAEGPFPRNLVVAPGTTSREELIASTKDGLLISRFWYIRPVDRKQTIVTGMTRDGTFVIRDGVVGPGVRNLRFNQSILAALASITLGDQAVRTIGYDYSIVVPHAKIDTFYFSSVTSF